jgi:hypothetical protein
MTKFSVLSNGFKALMPLNIQMFATTANTSVTVQSGAGSNSTKPNAWYDKLLLQLLVQTDWYHSRFAQERPMPARSGDTINFRKIKKLEPSLAPLNEGITPDGLNGQLEAISAVTAQYGDWMLFTDIVDVTVVDPVVEEYTKELARSAREKIDKLVRKELHAGTNVFYANKKASRVTVAAGDIPKIDDFRKMALAMKKAFVAPAVDGKYVVLISPETAFDLMDDPKFVKAYEIGQNNKPFIKGEVADVYGIKFVEVPNAMVFEGEGASAVDVHSALMLGQRCYGITKIKGNGDIQTITKGLGSEGSGDPLNQRQSIGWKINAFVAKRLYEEGICRYEHVPSNA